MPTKYNLTRLCTVPDCTRKYYQHGFCKNHHELFRRNGKPDYKYPLVKCRTLGCEEFGRFKLGFCSFHLVRLRHNIPLNTERYAGLRGENNHCWNGGTSEYPNHSLMKRNRIEVLERDNYMCQYCGRPANQVHHKDLSKENHSKGNLVACCRSCNAKMGKPRKVYNSKYRQLTDTERTWIQN